VSYTPAYTKSSKTAQNKSAGQAKTDTDLTAVIDAWPKIVVLGAVASFNKGMSGGGYGPLVTGGQMLSGVGVKNAVGITSVSEGITCLVGIIVYCFYGSQQVDWSLAPWLMAGAVLSVPIAAHTLKRIPENKAKIAIGIVVLGLGALTLGKVYFAG